MEGKSELRVAEVLADLAGLYLADEEAAHALVSSHLSLSQAQAQPRRPSKSPTPNAAPSTPQSLKRLTSGQKTTSAPSLLRHQSSTASNACIKSASPSLDRQGTTSPQQSIETPEGDADMLRAAKLMDLYDLKNKLQSRDAGELSNLRRQVDQVAGDVDRRRREVEADREKRDKEGAAWKEKMDRRQLGIRAGLEREAREREDRMMDGQDE